MKSDDNSSDRRLHHRVPASAAAAATSFTDEYDEYDCDDRMAEHSNQDGDRELDLEVNRFLETEFFATRDKSASAISSSSSSSSYFLDRPQASSAFAMRDDMMFADISDSIDMPDLDFGDVGDAFSNNNVDARASPDRASAVLPSQAKTAPTPAAAEAPKPASSLRVLIPASAFFAPSPAAQQRRPSNITVAPLRPTPTSGRKRIKDELEYLRQQVQEFENKLERLKRGGSSADGSSPLAAASLSSPTPLNVAEIAFNETTPHSSLWERIAKHQNDEKQKAKAENLKLKELLENQLKLARSLSRVLHKRHDISWLETPQPGQTTKKLRVASESDTGRFDILASQLETLYSELDTVLVESGLNSPKANIEHGGQVKTNTDGDVFIEVVDCHVLPFDFRTTAAAVWKLMSTSSLNFGNGQYQTVDATENSVRALLTVNLKLRRADTTIELSLVGKRVVEAERVVLVWCSMGETQGRLYGNDCVQVRESGWTVIRAETSNADDSQEESKGQPMATVQSIVRMTPELETSDSATSEDSEDRVGVLTDVVLSSFHQNLAILRQMIENLILNDAAESSELLAPANFFT